MNPRLMVREDWRQDLPTPAEATVLGPAIARIIERHVPTPRLRAKPYGCFLVRNGRRSFAFEIVAPRRRGSLVVTAGYKVRSKAIRALYREWPALFFDWLYNGQRERRAK